MPYLKACIFQQAVGLTSKSKTAIGKVMTYGLYREASARRRDDNETAMEESMMEVLPRLEKRTHYLATFANIATLMGLLGTIIGLIQAFTAVANANPAEKADMLDQLEELGLGGFWASDAEGNLTYLSPALAERLEIPLEDLIGHSL